MKTKLQQINSLPFTKKNKELERIVNSYDELVEALKLVRDSQALSLEVRNVVEQALMKGGV